MVALTEKEKIRSHHRDWIKPDQCNDKSIYSDSYTIDPSKVEGAWAIFSKSLLVDQVSHYPAIFHLSLLSTLRSRAKHGR